MSEPYTPPHGDPLRKRARGVRAYARTMYALGAKQADPEPGAGRLWLREHSARGVAAALGDLERIEGDMRSPEERLEGPYRSGWTYEPRGGGPSCPGLYRKRVALEMARRNGLQAVENAEERLRFALGTFFAQHPEQIAPGDGDFS